MHTSALEEAALTEITNEPQPETSEPTSAPEPETTALVRTEPDVIEGEVIEIAPPEPFDAHTPPKQKRYWLLIPLTILFCLIFLAASSLFPLLTPSATVTIIPVERNITLIAAIQVQGRELPLLTLMQSTSIPATGKRHQSARHAGVFPNHRRRNHCNGERWSTHDHRPGCNHSGWKPTDLWTSNRVSTCGSYRFAGEYSSIRH